MKEMLKFFIYSKALHGVVDKAFLENRKLTEQEKEKLDTVLDEVDKELSKILNITPAEFISVLEKLGVCYILDK